LIVQAGLLVGDMSKTVPGGMYAATHEASVRSICGDQTPPVFSRGTQFFNVDRWMDRLLLEQMVEWAEEHPGETPTEAALFAWVMACNVTPIPERRIHIASVPDDMDWSTAMALTGGAYHEGFHTRYTIRSTLTVDQIREPVTAIWGELDLSKYGRAALEALGWVDDVHIENCGNEEFPGVYQAMCDLQDFILDMEQKGLDTARTHMIALQKARPEVEFKDPQSWSEMSTLLAAFRDLGLGYTHTSASQNAIERYKSTHPEVFELVASGSVAPFVERAQKLPPHCGLDVLWLTLDLFNHLQSLSSVTAASGPSKEEEEESDVATRILSSSLGGDIPGILDNNEALSIALVLHVHQQSEELPPGEQPWHPYNPSLDRINIVGSEEGADRAALEQESHRLLDEVYGEVQYLRARLHRVIRATAFSGIAHGAQRGRRLSDRMLVHTKLSLRMGDMPDRAFVEQAPEVETSFAVGIVMDESTSMEGELETATKVMLALAEPMSALRSSDGSPFPVMACGFRDGHEDVERAGDGHWRDKYHRIDPVIYDVFKDFHEPFQEVLWRFSGTKAEGATPMSDGVQMALTKLRQRREVHRLLFVVTDGYPTGQHARVIRWQIRKATEENIRVIGVGIGPGSRGVMALFPDHVWAEEIEMLPEALVRKLNEILDFRALTRTTA